ncbi:MAG: phage terminase large subunit family protein [Deltaproteobacteria bacterium]|jgi:phage terminase large subunit GpA-like protein|nr:phage terminase large subunit family protein [Deltaproteobacteria bacterium]
MTTYGQIIRELASVLSQIYAPGCELNCWQWAEKNIFLTPEESRDNHGKYDSTLTIYVRRLMEFVTSPHEREFIIRKTAQLGFTLAYIIIIAYLAATRPTHVLYAMDSILEARRICTNRLQPLLKNCVALAEGAAAKGGAS